MPRPPRTPRRLLITAATLAAFLAGAPAARADWAWPVRGEVITSYRNVGDPYAAGQHRGIDIAAAVGTPVVAAAGGEVRFAGTVGSAGLTVSIRTANGRFDTSYLHLSSTTVREGDDVSTGDRLGAVGVSGQRSAAAPHLHFGVRRAGSRHVYRDPLSFLPPPPIPTKRPRPAPGPAPAPLPSPPERAPVPRAAPEPRLRPRLVLARRLDPVRRPQPLARPVLAPRAGPAPMPLPTHSLPKQVPAPREAPRQAPAPQTAPTPRAAPAPGLDLGYVLACAGQLLAAGVLGLSEGGRRATRGATRRGRTRLEGVLRPLLVRRP